MNSRFRGFSWLASRSAMLGVLLVAVSVCIFASCMPPGWLDDDHFVFGTHNGKIIKRNVVTGESETIYETKIESQDDGPPPLWFFSTINAANKQWVALRPDMAANPNDPAFVVEVYSKDGKLTSTSKPIAMPQVAGSDGQLIQIDHSNDARHALFSASDAGAVIVHRESETATFTKSVPLKLSTKWVWQGTTVVCPDAKSFLGFDPDREEPAILLTSLETGEVIHAFDLEPIMEQDIFLFSGPTDRFKVQLNSFWRGNVLVLPLNTGELCVDVEKKEMSFNETDEMKRLAAHAAKENANVIGTINDNLVIETVRENRVVFKVRLFDLESNETTDINELHGAMSVSVSKSPSGKHTLITGFQQPGMLMNVVFDAEGNMVDSFDYRHGIPNLGGK